MFKDKFDLFNIENIINVLKEKKNTNNYMLFQASLPHIDTYGKINIINGESCANPIYGNYFLTYGILHEFLQEYNSINLDTFKYFSKNILEKQEQDINSLAKQISIEENINLEEIKKFDYSHKNFFVDNKYFSKGSYIKNITYCYNNNKIYMNILDIFLIKNIHKKDKLLIKFPSIISQSILDNLKLIAYSFKKIIIFKNIFDSYFKDSFHVYAAEVVIDRYKEIQDIIINFKNKNNFPDTMLIKQILDVKSYSVYQNYEDILKDFTLFLEIIIFVFLVNLSNLINLDKKLTHRSDNRWKMLDYYNTYINK